MAAAVAIGKEAGVGVARHFWMIASHFDAGVDPVMHGENVAGIDWPIEIETETWTETAQSTVKECQIEDVSGTFAIETEIATWTAGIDSSGEKIGITDALIGMRGTGLGRSGNANILTAGHPAVAP